MCYSRRPYDQKISIKQASCSKYSSLYVLSTGLFPQVQIPACPWEFYMVCAVQKRLAQLKLNIDVVSVCIAIV